MGCSTSLGNEKWQACTKAQVAKTWCTQVMTQGRSKTVHATRRIFFMSSVIHHTRWVMLIVQKDGPTRAMTSFWVLMMMARFQPLPCVAGFSSKMKMEARWAKPRKQFDMSNVLLPLLQYICK